MSAAERTVLLAGYGWFAGIPQGETNNAELIARALDGTVLSAGCVRGRVHGLVIPVTWAGAFPPVEAAIAAVHASSEVSDRAGPVRIAVLYLWLERLVPTAPVRLARVVAVARAYGAERGAALLDELGRRHRWGDDPLVRRRERVVRAHLSEMVGDTGAAEVLYREAAALGANRGEGRYLLERADRLR